MHEISVMQQIIEVALREAQKNSAKIVTEVDLDVGELTFLGHEQLLFAFEILSKDTPLSGAKLKIKSVRSRLTCSCGYEGSMQNKEDVETHFFLPSYSCPKCEKKLNIVEGKECTLRRIKGET